MSCPSTGPKMFCASSKPFVPAQKPNLLNGNHLLVRHKIFGTGTKHFGTCRRTRHKGKLKKIDLGDQKDFIKHFLKRCRVDKI